MKRTEEAVSGAVDVPGDHVMTPGRGYPSSDQKTDDLVQKLQRHGRRPSEKGKIAPKGPEPIRVDIIVLHRLRPVGLIKMCPHGRILKEKTDNIYSHVNLSTIKVNG